MVQSFIAKGNKKIVVDCVKGAHELLSALSGAMYSRSTTALTRIH